MKRLIKRLLVISVVAFICYGILLVSHTIQSTERENTMTEGITLASPNNIDVYDVEGLTDEEIDYYLNLHKELESEE